MAVHQDFSHTIGRTHVAPVNWIASEDDDLGSMNIDTDEDSSSDHSDELIKKPQGQVARPCSGGYNLAKKLEQLGWTPDQFAKLRVSAWSNHVCRQN
jgi:hypothetical protein